MAQTTTINGGVQTASSMPALQGVSEEMRRCIQDCIECANICEQTVAYCLELGGRHASAEHIKLLQDCAEACSIAASYMARHSRFYEEQCSLCAEICRVCAESCERLGPDPQMKACAEACRQCEESCRNMIS